MQNTAYNGESQSAKTTTMIDIDAVPTAEANTCFIGYCDPDAEGGRIFAGRVAEMGDSDRLLVIDYSRPGYGCGWGLLHRSDNPNLFERAVENREFATYYGEVLSVSRGESLEKTRLIREWISFATELWQKSDAPPEKHAFGLMPNTTDWDAMRRFLTPDDPLAAKADFLKRLYATSVSRFYEVVGPALRLLEETNNEPQYRESLRPTFDLEQWMLENKIVVLLGGSNPQLNRVMMKSFLLRVDQIVEQRFVRYKTRTPCRSYVDESSRIVTQAESVAWRRNMKKGQTWGIADQHPMFEDPEVQKARESCFPINRFFRCGSGEVADYCAGYLLGSIDPHKIHSETEHVLVDSYRDVPTHTFTESMDETGKKRKGVTQGFAREPIPRLVKHAKYFEIPAQRTLIAQTLQTLNIGEYIERHGTIIRRVQNPKPAFPFQFEEPDRETGMTLMDEALEEVFQQRLAEGVIRKIDAWQPQIIQTTVAKKKPAKKPRGRPRGKPR